MKQKQYIFILMMVFTCNLFSQTTQWNAILGGNYTYKFAKLWQVSFESELRFQQNFLRLDRFKNNIDLGCRFWDKRIKAAMGFDYIIKNKAYFFDNRFRFDVSLTYYWKMENWKLNFRLKYQHTYYDEDVAFREFNPKEYLRGQLESTYDLLYNPLSFCLSLEVFVRTYQPAMIFADEIQTIAGIKYHFSNTSSIFVYCKLSNEIQVKNRENLYSIGVLYKLKNK